MPGMLRTIVIIEGGRSLGAGFVYGDSYGEEKNNTAVIGGQAEQETVYFSGKMAPDPLLLVLGSLRQPFEEKWRS